MKRWMFRLAALSTVTLAGLVLFAHAYRGNEKQAAVTQPEPTDEKTAIIKPIPLAAEPEASPGKSDPFARASRFVEQTEASEQNKDRYAQATNHEEPAAEQPAELQEPQRLDPPQDVVEIPAPRNPFRVGAPAPTKTKDVLIERAATEEPEGEQSQETLAAAEAGPSEALTAEPAINRRYERRPALARAETETAPVAGATRFGEAAETEPDTTAFAPTVGGTTRSTTAAGSGRPGDRKLEGRQSPSLVVEKTAPAEVQVGKPATFLVHVRNAGEVPANQVEIHDEVPQGAELVSTKPSAQNNDGKLVWQLGTLKPGEETTVEMQVSPTTEGELGSVASVTFHTAASVRTRATRPQLKLEATAPSKVLIGENATLRIRVSNPGSGPATGVVLTEQVPAGFKHEGGNQLEFEVGTLAPGESRDLELSLVAAQPGRVTNMLKAVGDAGLHVEEQDEIEVIAPALKVALQGPKRRYLQRNATYSVSVTNPGTAAAKNLELTATLPRGLKFVEANNEGQYDATSHTVVWSLTELPPGENGNVTFTTLAIEPGDLKLQVVGKAAMGLTDSLEESVSVEGVAAIFFELVDVNDPIEVGGETTYEIRVINQGSAAATNVRLVALLPPELKALDAGGPVQHTIEQGRVLFEPLGQLAPKADTMYTVKVQGQSAGDLRLRVQIVTDQITNPVTKEESTRVYSDE